MGLSLRHLQNSLKKFETPLITLVASICLSTVVLSFDFNFLEASLYDLRISHGYQRKANQDIVLVTLDDTTTQQLGQYSPLPLDEHVRFVEGLAALEPRAVGYLVNMDPVYQMNPALFAGKWGTRFIKSVEALSQKQIPFLIGTPFDVTGEVQLPSPLQKIPHAIAVLHKDGNVFGEDKVTRRALLSLYDKPAFHLDLAQRMGSIHSDELPPGNYLVPQIEGRYFFFRYYQSTVFCDQNCSNQYPRYSFVDILKNRISPDKIRNKILLVGTLSSDDSADFTLTPYSKVAYVNPKLAVHANILDSILNHEGILRVPSWINVLVTLSLTFAVMWWIMTSTPLYGVCATVVLGLFFLIVSHALFQNKGWWLRESQPLVGIFISYYLSVPYRLIREYKTRWNYQQENQLMVQVEELKTNFLNLITHDLKTPVARIQGLIEVLLRKAQPRLLNQDVEALKHILESTEELNRFISSVLELNQVENKRIQIQRQSKDINRLIEQSVETFSAKAHSKKIKITPCLEPLFPIRIDASLISKVLNNLIDNAIKYSPEGSEVRIESKEENEWVCISISDQGFGMTREEQKNLFTRFYRAKNDRTTTIPGTGLGLYLTKFFIEAHQGSVQVVSDVGKGSTFRIFLPLNDPMGSKVEAAESLFPKEDLHVQSFGRG